MQTRSPSDLRGSHPVSSAEPGERRIAVRGLWGLRIREWRRRMRERHEISAPVWRDLRDIRLDRGGAGEEIRKPFWRR